MREYTDEERKKAKQLAEELKRKMEMYWPKECTEEEKEEIRSLRNQLEEMGFTISWTGVLDPQTLNFQVDLTLLVPKQIH